MELKKSLWIFFGAKDMINDEMYHYAVSLEIHERWKFKYY